MREPLHGIHCGSCLEQQALGREKVIDGGLNLISQLVFLQPVTEPQDDAFVRQAPIDIELGKLPLQEAVRMPLQADVCQTYEGIFCRVSLASGELTYP